MKQVPYIGVTGFMTPQEVRAALRCFEGPGGSKLMVGVLASSKTLDHRPNKWPGRYPKPERIAEIFQDHIHALNLIHYATDDKTTLCRQLIRMLELGGEHLDGFQLNVSWPNQTELLHFKKATEGKMRIVLQIGKSAMASFDNRPAQIAEVIRGYSTDELISDILIDPSGGKGEPFDPVLALELLKAIRNLDLNIGVGVAGGLGPGNMSVLHPILDEFPDLSIDAEGALREKTDDDLVLALVEGYLNQAQLQMYEVLL